MSYAEPSRYRKKCSCNTHTGVNQVVDEAGGGIGDGGKENGTQGTFLQASVNLIEGFLGFFLLSVSLYHLLVSNHLIDKGSLFPTGLGLQLEHGIGFPGDKACYK